MNTLREKYNKTATTQLSEKKFAEACCGCISSKSRRGCAAMGLSETSRHTTAVGGTGTKQQHAKVLSAPIAQLVLAARAPTKTPLSGDGLQV
jgi:hypothetical protein